MGKRFNRFLREAAKRGINVGDINQASAIYLGGGGAGPQAQQDFQESQAQKQAQQALVAQQNRLADLQAERNRQAEAARKEAMRQAAIVEARRKKLEAQRTVGSATGRGGLKLTGVKERAERTTRRSRRNTLDNRQQRLNSALANLLKVGNLNLGN